MLQTQVADHKNVLYVYDKNITNNQNMIQVTGTNNVIGKNCGLNLWFDFDDCGLKVGTIFSRSPYRLKN